MMGMLRVVMKMTMTTRVAEVMPLDTKAAEVETNKQELIITKTFNKQTLICLDIKVYLLKEIIHICGVLNIGNTEDLVDSYWTS